MKAHTTNFERLNAFNDEDQDYNVIIDTPQNSRNKFKYDEKHGLFKLAGVLPLGTVFPYNFGDIPSTLGEDGDPIDVLVLMDEPVFVGCLVGSRLIGVIEAEQTEDGQTVRNDRLLAVATNSRNHEEIKSIDDLTGSVLDEIEHFFESYNDAKGKKFKVLGRFGLEKAKALVKQAQDLYQKDQTSS